MKRPSIATLIFQEIFLTVILLTATSAGTSLYLASQSTLSPQQNLLLESSIKTWQRGDIAIFALLGLKSTNLLRPQNKTDEEESK